MEKLHLGTMIASSSFVSAIPSLFCACFLLSIYSVVASAAMQTMQNYSCPAIFVFGDSTVDPGNNNYWPTPFKGNFPPYGWSFMNRISSGRFSDGKLVTDYIASHLGIKELVPPYLDSSLGVDELLTGVSFAFAGSGFDPMTAHTTGVVGVNQQLEYMNEWLARSEKMVGQERTAKIVEESIFVVSAGTNDLVISYDILPSRKQTFNVEEYQRLILQKLELFLEGLYEIGARRILVAGLPPMGCLPVVMTVHFQGALFRECIQSLNSVSQSYNSKLQSLLKTVREEKFPEAKIVPAEIYQPLLDEINNPDKYGFAETKRGCCGTGLLEMTFLCNPNTLVCPDASSYVFWDAIHPSQRAYNLIANNIIQNAIPLLFEHRK